MGVAVRQEVTKTLLKLMSSQEDSVRTTAAACLGALTASLPDEERTDVIISHLLSKFIMLTMPHIIVTLHSSELAHTSQQFCCS